MVYWYLLRSLLSCIFCEGACIARTMTHSTIYDLTRSEVQVSLTTVVGSLFCLSTKGIFYVPESGVNQTAKARTLKLSNDVLNRMFKQAFSR